MDDVMSYLNDLSFKQNVDDIKQEYDNQLEEISYEESDINYDTEYEYILLRRDRLINILKLTSPIINLKSSKQVPKSINIYYTDNNFYYIATDDISYFKTPAYQVRCSDNFKDSLCLPITLIHSIINMLPDYVLFYKKENKFYVRLLTGDLYLDLVQPEESMLKVPCEIGDPVMFNMPTGIPTNVLSNEDIHYALKALMPIVSEELIPENKRLFWYKDRMIFFTGKYLIQSRMDLPELKLSYRSADFIKKLTQIEKTSMSLYRAKDNNSRLIIQSNNYFYTTFISNVNKDERIISYLDKLENNLQSKVKAKQLNHIVDLASSLYYANGYIGFNYEKKDDIIYLVITLPTTKESSVFRIPVITYVDMFAEGILNKEPVYILSKSFKKLLASFTDDELSLNVSDKGVLINSGPLTGMLMK